MTVPISGQVEDGGADGHDHAGGHEGPSVIDVVRRRIDGTAPTDAWGLDPDLIGLVSGLGRLRWSVDVQWAERLPTEGPAVLVHNRRFGVSETSVVAEALTQATGRRLRPAGVIDVAPVGSLLRHLGAVAADPDEVRGVLAAGEVVGVSLGRELRWRRAGALAAEALTPAVAPGVTVVPVAVIGRELGRRRRVLVGEPASSPRRGGPLAAVELVERTRAAVQGLLDEGGPPAWVPTSGRLGR